MQIDSDNVLLGLATFVGTTVVGMLTTMWRKVSGQETRIALLEQAKEHHEEQRAEDRERAREDRTHYDTQFNKIEKLIKNGHSHHE